jgi:hypothetical protein
MNPLVQEPADSNGNTPTTSIPLLVYLAVGISNWGSNELAVFVTLTLDDNSGKYHHSQTAWNTSKTTHAAEISNRALRWALTFIGRDTPALVDYVAPHAPDMSLGLFPLVEFQRTAENMAWQRLKLDASRRQFARI